MSKKNETADAPTRELPSRLERLQALKEGRVLGKVTSLAGGAKEPASRRAVTAKPEETEGNSRQDPREKLSVTNPVVKKMLRALTKVSEDGNDSMVPGTPFTSSGVARLMKVLGEKSLKPEEKGAKMAIAMLDYLKPVEGEETVGGGSVDKLKAIARMADPQSRNRR